MPLLEPLIARFGAPAVKIAGIALLVVVILALAYCAGGRGQVTKYQQATIKQQKEVKVADDHASATRVADAVRVETAQKDLTDALAHATTPDDLRVVRGCLILRQQGRDTAAIPACR